MVANIGAILVPIAVPSVWIQLMSLNWKELLLRIISIPSNIKILLNLGRNLSWCLSIQNEIACFLNSWGILRYRFVTSNVAISVQGSIFSGMEFKESMLPLIYLFILFRKGCNKMSISLLGLLVGHDDPATMVLNLRSLGFGISICSDFCVSTAFFICLDL